MFKWTHLRNHLFSCVLDERKDFVFALLLMLLPRRNLLISLIIRQTLPCSSSPFFLSRSCQSSPSLIFFCCFFSSLSLLSLLLSAHFFFFFFARGLGVSPILSSVCFSFLLPADVSPLIEQQLLKRLTPQSFNDNLIPSIPPSSCLSLLSQFIWPLIWSSLSWGSDHTRACNDSTFIN